MYVAFVLSSLTVFPLRLNGSFFVLACVCDLCLIYFGGLHAEVEWVIFCPWLVYVAFVLSSLAVSSCYFVSFHAYNLLL